MTAVIDGSRATDTSKLSTPAKESSAPRKRSGDAAVGEGKSPRTRGSTAAQRAYQRRQQRAGSSGGSGGVLPRRSGRFAARIPFVVAVIGLLGCGLALTLLLTTRSAEDSYQLGAARADNQRRVEERAALQRDVEAGNSAPELAARARQLGMIPAPDPARLLVGPDGTITVVGTPQPADGPPAPLLDPPQQTRAESAVPVRPPSSTIGALVPVAPPSAPVRAEGAQRDQLVPATIAGPAPTPAPTTVPAGTDPATPARAAAR